MIALQLASYLAGVTFTLGAMTPIGAVALIGLAFLRPRKRTSR